MRLIRKVQLMGRGATFGALAGLAAGLALAVPGAPSASGVIHAVLAGAGVTAPPPTTEHPGHTTPPPPTTVTTEHPWTEHPSTTTTVQPTTEPTTSTTTPPTSTTEPTTSAGPTTPTGAGDPPSGPATCDGTITAFKVVLVDGGRGIQLTVLVSGHVGWMSAYAEGFGGAALSPITGGFQGTITGHEPVAPGTKVLVGSCGNRVRASAVVGGDATPPADPTTTTIAPAGPTTTAPSGTSRDLPAGCSTASITSVTAVLLDGGLEVRGAVQVNGSVGWMSGAIEGPGGVMEGITLNAVPGGFVGTATSSTPFPAGSTLVVGTCGGKLRGSAPVLVVT